MHRILPPASREAVLGDLWESCRTPRQFLSQGLAILPFVILTQVRRRSSWPVLVLQAFVLFACLRGFSPVDAHPPMWARAALPTLFAFLALAWHDTYRATQPALIARRLRGEATAVLLAITFYEAVIALLSALAVLPDAYLLRPVELFLAACSLPVLFVLRAGSRILAAPLPDARPSPDAASVLRDDYTDFRRAVRRWNRLEVAAMIATLLLAVLVVAQLPAAVSMVVWLTLASLFSLVIYLLLKGDAPAMPRRDLTDHVRQAFQREIMRQHRLRSRLVWWWFAPLFMGLTSRFVGPGAGGAGGTQTIAGLVLMTMLAACIDALNRDRENLVKDRIDRLASRAGRLG